MSDINKQAEELIRVAESSIAPVDSATVSGLDLSEIDIEKNEGKYGKFSEQLKFLNLSLKHFMQQNYRRLETQDRERIERTKEVPKTLYNAIAQYVGLKQKEVIVEKKILEKVELDVPLNEGTPEDLQNMIRESAHTLKQCNKEIAPTILDIDKVVKSMRSLEKQHLQLIVQEKTSYDSNNLWLETAIKTVASLKQELKPIKITDKDFVKTINNLEDLENLVVKKKYEIKENNVNTTLFMNQKNALRVYEKCLDLAKHSAKQTMGYVENFANTIIQLNISVQNVAQVCDYIAKASDIGQSAVTLMRTGQKHLAGLLSLANQVYASPPVDKVVEVAPLLHQIDIGRSSLDSELEKYKEQQKKLDETIKPYLIEHLK